MALRAVQERSLGDRVFDQLAAEIMSERYPAGASLPPERSLAEIFKVNRHVVREALKRLEQVGLISISRSGGAAVTDFKRDAGLDLLGLMAEHAHGGEVDKYLRSVLEMRALIGADIVRLCALRASPAVRADLVDLARQMRTAPTDATLFALEVGFWERLLDGADNIAYRLSFNSLLKGAVAMGPMAQEWSLAEVRSSDYRGPLADAIARGNAAEAEAICRRVMGALVDVLRAGASPADVTPANR
jgi:GntR family transcriptional repressor for pyruvate dehydrogenase complex